MKRVFLAVVCAACCACTPQTTGVAGLDSGTSAEAMERQIGGGMGGACEDLAGEVPSRAACMSMCDSYQGCHGHFSPPNWCECGPM
jgi:hypothetical protein